MKIVLFLLLWRHSLQAVHFLSTLPNFDLIDKEDGAKFLDLVTNEQILSDPPETTMSDYLVELRKLSFEFRNCLVTNGFVKKSFEKCMGSNYSKVKTAFDNTLVTVSGETINDFKTRLGALSDKGYNAFTSEAIDNLKLSIISNEDPLPKLRELSQKLTMPEFDRHYVDQTFDWLKERQDYFEKAKRYMGISRKEAVDNIIAMIDTMDLKTNFSYKTNPFIVNELPAQAKPTTDEDGEELRQVEVKHDMDPFNASLVVKQEEDLDKVLDTMEKESGEDKVHVIKNGDSPLDILKKEEQGLV